MATPTGTEPADPLALLRTRPYLALLVLAAFLGVPIAAIAYGFLKLVNVIQNAVFAKLPSGLGFHSEPLWWPLLPLAVAGLLVALTIRYLPGKGGHSPADGFHTGGGVITPAQIPGVFLAALTTLSLGAVLGPEAPLIALGAGLASWRCTSPSGTCRPRRLRWSGRREVSPPSPPCSARRCPRPSC